LRVTLLGKEHNLDFKRYSNNNINITAKPSKGGRSVSVTSNTIMRLDDDAIALRDSKNMIDELILAKVIKGKYYSEVNEAGNKMLIYKLTNFCIKNKGE